MSVKLEVGKRYVVGDDSVAEVIYQTGENFVAIHDFDQKPRRHTVAGFAIDEDPRYDLIAEAPPVVDVWFVINSEGRAIHISLIEPKAEGYKIVGPVRVEVPR